MPTIKVFLIKEWRKIISLHFKMILLMSEANSNNSNFLKAVVSHIRDSNISYSNLNSKDKNAETS